MSKESVKNLLGKSNEIRQEIKVAGRALRHSEWLKEGERRFGSDRRAWRYVCASCGRVQEARDFMPYQHLGAEPKDAMYKCLSVYSGDSDCRCSSPLLRPVEVRDDNTGLGLGLVFEFAEERLIIVC